MNAVVEIPLYQSHKKVRAAKITEMAVNNGGIDLTLGEIGGTVHVDLDWVQRRGPLEIGGYYVVYEDGYSSYSPAQAFEEGYTRIAKEQK